MTTYAEQQAADSARLTALTELSVKLRNLADDLSQALDGLGDHVKAGVIRGQRIGRGHEVVEPLRSRQPLEGGGVQQLVVEVVVRVHPRNLDRPGGVA